MLKSIEINNEFMIFKSKMKAGIFKCNLASLNEVVSVGKSGDPQSEIFLTQFLKFSLDFFISLLLCYLLYQKRTHLLNISWPCLRNRFWLIPTHLFTSNI